MLKALSTIFLSDTQVKFELLLSKHHKAFEGINCRNSCFLNEKETNHQLRLSGVLSAMIPTISK